MDYDIRANWYALYLAIKKKMSCDDALKAMCINTYTWSRIDDEQLEEMTVMKCEGKTYEQIGQKFGFSTSTTYRILKKRGIVNE